ncbi:MAG TPA: hypothetical protein VNK96_08375 [Fimbriimonadales bacterium]|nr:hypothetical protein [Fimbriimonadales bacterium]
MILTLSFFAFIQMSAVEAQFELPDDPLRGLALERNGDVLFGTFDDRTKTSRVGVYKIQQGKLVLKSYYPPQFKGDLDIIPTKNGMFVLDYDGESLYSLRKNGSIEWKTNVKMPHGMRIDSQGNLWFFFPSGMVFRKTNDSSEVEPLLLPNGKEFSHYTMLDIAPLPKGDFYLLDEQGKLYYVGLDKKKTFVRNLSSSRILVTPQGDLITFVNGAVCRLNRAGDLRVLWSPPRQVGAQVCFMDWTFDGRLLVAAKVGERRGIAWLIKKEALK